MESLLFASPDGPGPNQSRAFWGPVHPSTHANRSFQSYGRAPDLRCHGLRESDFSRSSCRPVPFRVAVRLRYATCLGGEEGVI